MIVFGGIYPCVNGQVKMGLNGHEKSPQMAIELKK